MGSNFHSAEFDGKLTRSELVKQYNLLVEEERIEYGSGAYKKEVEDRGTKWFVGGWCSS